MDCVYATDIKRRANPREDVLVYSNLPFLRELRKTQMIYLLPQEVLSVGYPEC